MLSAMQAWLPALTIFFGSFLLFGIQPMLGRTLLPPFGGSAAVWTVCLAAYQLLLLLGYGYAHVVAHQSARTQRRLHLGLLVVAVMWTFGFASMRLLLRGKLGDFSVPATEVLFCVLAFVGLPYVLLSANSTLIQAWLAKGLSPIPSDNTPIIAKETTNPVGHSTLNRGSRQVYRLYALSNLGSLSGLLIYPFVLEPFVSLDAQWYGFAACLSLYVVLLFFVARLTMLPVNALCHHTVITTSACIPDESYNQRIPTSIVSLPVPLTRPWLWLALPGLSTFLLNAVTVHLSTDVTPVPMMWVLLLTAFLFSYILGFSNLGEKGLIIWTGLAVIVLLCAAFISGLRGGRAFLPNLSSGVMLVLICCTFLHAWLYRIRPEASHLTHFYLCIAAGGALGGACASLIAPVVFSRVWEYPIALIAACGFSAWLIHVWDHPEVRGLNRFLLVLCGISVLLISKQATKGSGSVINRSRNFYGCLRVDKDTVTTSFGDPITLIKLCHGDTLHGMQFHDRFLKDKPTTYYGPKGGGVAISSHPQFASGQPLRVGLIGLGAGTMAVYGRTNDFYRFFEINPAVVSIATSTNYFTFIADSAAQVDFVMGDARKKLEQERTRQEPLYDVLVVDAYSGDSVPLHLATREAFQLYLDRLAPDGTLAVHISNWHIDLAPLCKAVSSSFGLSASGVVSPPDGFSNIAYWVYLTRATRSFLSEGTREINWDEIRVVALPSDEQGSLLPLIRFSHTPPVRQLNIDLDKLRLF